MKEARKRVTLLNWSDGVLVIRWAFLTTDEAADLASDGVEDELTWQVLDGWVRVDATHVEEQPS